MGKKKALGFLDDVGEGVKEVLESVADVVEGTIFGKPEKAVANGTEGQLGSGIAEQNIPDSGNENEDRSESKPKPVKPPKLSDSFKPSTSGEKKGKASGNTEQAEDSGGTTEPETA